MKLRSLEVADFRRIRRAKLELGPGLNVVYGPNDLGKSTLVEALRAALLLPSTSTVANEYVPWDRDATPAVALELEHRGVLYCVKKSWGTGTRASALLERADDGHTFAVDAKSREVDGKLRDLLLGDRRLPADCRHLLLGKLGEALGGSRLVVAMMGKERAMRVARDACVKASVTLIDRTGADEYPALVEHLRLRGELTQGFLVRMVAHGKIDFFGAALVALSGQGQARVRALLADGRDVALRALLNKARLSRNTHEVILRALKVWREVANGKRLAGVQEVSWLMLREIGATPGQTGPADADRELATLLKSIHLDELRDNARGHALAIAAA